MSEERESSTDSEVMNGSKFKLTSRSTILVAIVLILVGGLVYFWNDARIARQQTVEAVQQRLEDETADVEKNLARIIDTSSLGEPTIAKVEDPEILKAKNPEYYANVQVGDYLVLYPERAIIYRLSENKIINVAPIINSSSETQGQQQTQPDSVQ